MTDLSKMLGNLFAILYNPYYMPQLNDVIDYSKKKKKKKWSDQLWVMDNHFHINPHTSYSLSLAIDQLKIVTKIIAQQLYS